MGGEAAAYIRRAEGPSEPTSAAAARSRAQAEARAGRLVHAAAALAYADAPAARHDLRPLRSQRGPASGTRADRVVRGPPGGDRQQPDACQPPARGAACLRARPDPRLRADQGSQREGGGRVRATEAW